ncbi:MAG: hypothetical protein Q9171_005396 [Xanthocarpia ochracea]
MAAHQQDLPTRTTGSVVDDEDAVPDIDPTNTSGLLEERLQAYKHACRYLEAYISATEKVQKAHSKEYEKVLKTVSDPLKEGHHFDQSLGGIAGLFENIRSNTQGIANSHLEAEKTIKGSVLPILERLHAEIKNKSKELSKGAVKGSKEVDKARNITQKHIELLGQYTAAFSSSGGKVDPSTDPYVLQRRVNHHLHKQVLEENNNRHDLIEVQNSFSAFEAHIIQTFQQALQTFLQCVGGQLERQKAMYSDIVSTAQKIPLDFEFKKFVHRNSQLLVDPSAPKRDVSHISFPNQNHPSTQAVIAGTLERKSRAMGALKGYSTDYYVVTPSKFLHEFKDDDDFRKDPTPELSLYLPDCTIGALNGEKFNIKGKDASKGKVGGALAMSHELSFKAHSPADAERWYNVIKQIAGGSATYTNEPASPISPVEARNVSEQQPPPDYQEKGVTPVQTQGLSQGQGAVSGGPMSAGAHTQQPYNTPVSGGGLQSAGVGSTPTSGVEREPDAGIRVAYPTVNMQTVARYGERPPSKRHAPQISISDDNYHVTEAIGDYYGKRESRPLSFIASPPPKQTGFQISPAEPLSTIQARNPTTRTLSTEGLPQMNGQGSNRAGRHNNVDPGRSPPPSQPLRTRSNSDTANTQFPLNDIEYESNPEAVAQELSNLQALRRMSMNANTAGDPDLPSFNSNFGIPNAPPSGKADEDDSARLFWVPARIHPELAPTEFKTFIDSKVNSIKRRSGDGSLSPDGLPRAGSGGGLRRKKSMLSRQIDNSGGRGAEGYQDGAERLDRKKSLSGAETLNTGISNLQDLEELVNDSATVMQRLSIDTGQGTSGGEGVQEQDMPILPAAPGNSLRRSTRTTYRRSSVRKADRVPFSKRVGRGTDTDGEDSPISTPITPAGETLSLSRVQTEPMPPTERVTENFSRPGRLNRRTPQQNPQSQPSQDDNHLPQTKPDLREPPRQGPPAKHFVSQIASNGRSSISPHVFGPTVPQIVESPPDDARHAHKPSYVPERSSSHEPPPPLSQQGPPTGGPPNARGPKWPPPLQTRPIQNQKGNQTLSDIASHPSPLPGSSTRTDSLSFIPTLSVEEKKADTKKAKEKKEKEAAEGSRKSSWSWGSMMGSDDKEKERKKEEEAKKIKSKVTRPVDKSHDNTRLDVLQTTMEGNRGRESLVLDRGDVKLEEERKKESSRKSSGGDKKEKDSGIFSSLFGGGKKKGAQEVSGKKSFARNLSPEPPPRILKPDIDYNWTRFSILEERAIYRMAHIKLANPRRALHSQVLLSNFMYSYLAKVQQMHPQIQMPAQKQQAQQKKADQPEEFYQYQKYQEQQQKQQQEEEVQSQVAGPAPGQAHTPSHHIDNAADFGGQHDGDHRNRPQSRASQYSAHGSESGGGHTAGHQHRKQHHAGAGQSQPSSYQLQQLQFEEPGRSGEDDMW